MNISFGYYPGGKKKALTMSYDDGQVHDRKLVEIFNKYGIKGTFHLNSGLFNNDPYINSSEVEGLYKGHEVSAHSSTHPYLTLIPDSLVIEEIMEDRKELEELVGYPVRGMSYPFGVYSEKLLQMLPGLGIEYSRTVQSHGSFSLPENFMTWHPSCHHDQNLLEMLKEFKKPAPWSKMRLFYVWGHSFEFDRNDNWNLIEEFCKAAGGDPDVWYATNIEVMDYIKALRNLKYNVDRTIIYNPSSISVWLDVNGQPVKVGAGQQKVLEIN